MGEQSNKQLAQGNLAEAQIHQNSPEALGGESMQLQPITDEKEELPFQPDLITCREKRQAKQSSIELSTRW